MDALTTSGFACLIWTYSFSYAGGVGPGTVVQFGWSGAELVIPAVTVLLVGIRRVLPWPVLLALLAVDWFDRWQDISSEPFGVAMALCAIAEARPRRQKVLAGVVAVAVLVLSVILIDRSLRGFWTCLVVYVLGLVVGVALQRAEANRWRVLRLMAEAQAERRASRRAEERAALALEVHDVCSSALAIINRLGETARLRLGTDPESTRRLLMDVSQLAQEGMAEVRRFVRLAESDPADGDLDALLARVRATGVPLTARVSGAPCDHGSAITVYRVVQEALTNVLRHARPTTVSVDVRYGDDGGVSLSVVNDGVRPSRAVQRGRGMRGMVERVARVGGSAEVGPMADVGWWGVHAVVPAPPRPRSRTAGREAVAR